LLGKQEKSKWQEPKEKALGLFMWQKKKQRRTNRLKFDMGWKTPEQ
jgi:hypothetical protein